MPLVRVELPAGKPAEYRVAVGKAIQQAMHAALKVPLEERFHIFTEHTPVDLVINQTYLGIERSADAIVVQVTLNEGRDAEVKRGFLQNPGGSPTRAHWAAPGGPSNQSRRSETRKLVVRQRQGSACLTQTAESLSYFKGEPQ
jgi:hypothetical protein